MANVRALLILVAFGICHSTQAAPSAVPRDCADIRAQGQTTSGVYTVYIGESQRLLAVYCDMTTRSVGWTVFQRRQDGSVNFQQNWKDYQTGFGNISGEFWIGNDNLHLLTTGKRYRLRVELENFAGWAPYAEFDNFTVASEADKYRLTSIGKYSGTAGDSLSYHVGMQFSTIDNDNDMWSDSCSLYNGGKGGWWFNFCLFSNPNGWYYTKQQRAVDGLRWYHMNDNDDSMKRTQLKITPIV